MGMKTVILEGFPGMVGLEQSIPEGAEVLNMVIGHGRWVAFSLARVVCGVEVWAPLRVLDEVAL